MVQTENDTCLYKFRKCAFLTINGNKIFNPENKENYISFQTFSITKLKNDCVTFSK